MGHRATAHATRPTPPPTQSDGTSPSATNIPLLSPVPHARPFNPNSPINRHLLRREPHELSEEDTPDHVLCKTSKPILESWIHQSRLRESPTKQLGSNVQSLNVSKVSSNSSTLRSDKDDLNHDISHFRRALVYEERTGRSASPQPGTVLHRDSDVTVKRPNRTPSPTEPWNPRSDPMRSPPVVSGSALIMSRPSYSRISTHPSLASTSENYRQPAIVLASPPQTNSYSRMLQNSLEQKPNSGAATLDASKKPRRLPSMNERKVVGLIHDEGGDFHSPAMCNKLGISHHGLKVGNSVDHH
eukprot:TRINITY_DN8363_c0_g1_i19.p1 TRINITY_DN8363_c0_g1~~TRINITY_DN8363_c0_g1_i19.p1  ORF type:complete len:300 (+),score=42.38 TRINITY_DN8363_c0_g1_i19:111-1010(+)